MVSVKLFGFKIQKTADECKLTQIHVDMNMKIMNIEMDLSIT